MRKWMLPVVIGILFMFFYIDDVSAKQCTYYFTNHWSMTFTDESDDRTYCTYNGGKVVTVDCFNTSDYSTFGTDRAIFNFDADVGISVLERMNQREGCPELYYFHSTNQVNNGPCPNEYCANGFSLSLRKKEGYEAALTSVSTDNPENSEKPICQEFRNDMRVFQMLDSWKTATSELKKCTSVSACDPDVYTERMNNYNNQVTSFNILLEQYIEQYGSCMDASNQFKEMKDDILEEGSAIDEVKAQYNQTTGSLSPEEKAKVDAANRLYEEINKKLSEIRNLEFSTILSCQDVLGTAIKYVEGAMTIIQIAAPILLIVLGSMDLAGAVIASDQDALKKATSKLVRRAIAAVAIFFVPLLVKLLIEMTGLTDIPDIACGLAYLYRGGIL